MADSRRLKAYLSPMATKPTHTNTVARNRKARFNFEIEETLEAGLVLQGSEVKSLREGRANIAEAYAAEQDGAMWLVNAYIPEYNAANQFNHETHRPRKLLLHAREIDKLIGATNKDGMTVVPLDIHFNRRGIAKCTIGIARGKKQYDKRQTQKNRDWDRQKQRLLRDKG